MEFEILKEKAQKYLPPEKMAVIEAAYKYAVVAHDGQTRKSGEPYIEHPLQVILNDTILPKIKKCCRNDPVFRHPSILVCVNLLTNCNHVISSVPRAV